MARHLYSLRNVPDDEAEDLQQVLTDAGVDFYATPPGNWGISAGALWLRDESQLELARQLIADYQQIREREAKALRQQVEQSGGKATLLDSFRQYPVRFIVFIGFALFILYVSTWPFLDLGGWGD